MRLRTILVLVLLLTCIFNVSAQEVEQKSVEKTARVKPLDVGETAPDFTLADQNGKMVSLSDVKTKTPVVLVFYRGYW